MKLKHIIICTLVLVTITGLYSCNKNKSDAMTQLPAFEMSENSKLVYNKLVRFKHQLNSSKKSSTTYSIDSAQWYAEAYYNVSSGYPDSAYTKFAVDSVSFFVPIDENNLVSLSSMTVLMSEIANHLETLLAQNESESAHLVVGDVSFDMASRSSQVLVIVTSGIGIGTNWGLYRPFVNQSWYYGETLGRCDTTAQIYADAGEELQWRFNSPNPYWVPQPACVDGTIKVISSGVHWNTGLTNSLIYSEFKAGAYDPPCHDSPYWNVYLNNGATVFYGNEASGGVVPDGNNFFTSVDVFSFHNHVSEPVEGYIYYHGYNTFYAVYECLGNIN